VNDRLAGAAVKVGKDAAVTVSVMGIVFGLFDAPEEVSVTLPV
jgi:hypothetical protein